MKLISVIRRALKTARKVLPLLPQWLVISRRMFVDRLNGRKIVIVDVEELQYAPFVFPVVDALKDKHDIAFYAATLAVYRAHALFDEHGIPPERRFDVHLSRFLPLARGFLSAHIYARGPRDAVRIHMFHNQPVKHVRYPQSDFEHFNVHFLLGPLCRKWTEGVIASFGLEGRGIELVDVGYPKIDELVSGAHERGHVLRGLGLDPSLTSVLYAPSWDEGLSLRSYGMQVVEAILSVPDVNVLVKLHPASCVSPENPSFEFYTGGVRWPDVFRQFAEHPRFRFITDNYINPILSASDIMITDVSSIALEYIVLDRPIIYFDCPGFFAKTLTTTYSQYGFEDYQGDARNDPMLNAGRHTGVVIGSVAELPAALRRSIDAPQRDSGKRRELARQLLYHPGSGRQHAAAAICRLLGQPATEPRCGPHA